jgi:hypothetical protein
MKLKLVDVTLNPNGVWDKPINKVTYFPIVSDFYMFDQTGYDLTTIERIYAQYNHAHLSEFGNSGRFSLKFDWFKQDEQVEGAILNHSYLFERKAYKDTALEQLQMWTKIMPLCHKLIAIRAKWGLDFSMDYVSQAGDVFELLHWEYDGFNYNEIQDHKLNFEEKFTKFDWNDAGRSMLKRKDEWHHLEYFPQSEWKCKYFGIVNERFKMVIWK